MGNFISGRLEPVRWVQPDLQRDLRQAMRFPLSCRLRVSWPEGSGSTGYQAGHGLNISEHGVAFVVSSPLPVMALVQLELPNSRQTVTAQIRNCLPMAGRRWRIGAELAGSFVSAA